jgi:Tetratricopeptide repeat
MGRWNEVYTVESFILNKQTSLYGDKHSDTILAMSNFANTLGDLGQLEEAATMKKKVLKKRRRILGEEHSDMISTMSNFANTLRE